jgi:hypothetical protein
MNTKTAIAITALVAVLGLVVAPLSIGVASARLTTTCDTGEPTCPGASATKGQGHELETCNSGGNCPAGHNKD